MLGEVWSMYNTLAGLQASGAYALALPNVHNLAISLSFIMKGMILSYLIGLPVMFSHMVTQRHRAYAKLKQN